MRKHDGGVERRRGEQKHRNNATRRRRTDDVAELVHRQNAVAHQLCLCICKVGKHEAGAIAQFQRGQQNCLKVPRQQQEGAPALQMARVSTSVGSCLALRADRSLQLAARTLFFPASLTQTRVSRGRWR